MGSTAEEAEKIIPLKLRIFKPEPQLESIFPRNIFVKPGHGKENPGFETVVVHIGDNLCVEEELEIPLFSLYFSRIRALMNLGLIMYPTLKNKWETAMIEMFSKGENVRHNKKVEWGIGQVTAVDKCGTIRVKFEGTQEVSIAKGSKFLVRVDAKGKKLLPKI